MQADRDAKTDTATGGVRTVGNSGWMASTTEYREEEEEEEGEEEVTLEDNGYMTRSYQQDIEQNEEELKSILPPRPSNDNTQVKVSNYLCVFSLIKP